MFIKDLCIAIIRQAVDDYIWSSQHSRRFWNVYPDIRYKEFYFNDAHKLRHRNEILAAKINMSKDVKDFFNSDFGYYICMTIINYDSGLIYNSLKKRYGMDDIIKYSLEEDN